MNVVWAPPAAASNERNYLAFRCEMFNATNTPHFAVPNGVLNNVNAGKINRAGPAWVMQFALKVVSDYDTRMQTFPKCAPLSM